MKILGLCISIFFALNVFASAQSQFLTGKEADSYVNHIRSISSPKEIKLNISDEKLLELAQEQMESFNDKGGFNFEDLLVDVVVSENDEYYCETKFSLRTGDGPFNNRDNFLKYVIGPNSILFLTTEFHNYTGLIYETICLKWAESQ